jgi:hypothetical protein
MAKLTDFCLMRFFGNFMNSIIHFFQALYEIVKERFFVLDRFCGSFSN